MRTRKTIVNPPIQRQRKTTTDPFDNYVLPDLPKDLKPFETVYSRFIKSIINIRNSDGDFKEEQKAIRNLLKSNKDFDQWLYKAFPLHLKRDQDRWPMAWMISYKSIRVRISDPNDKAFARLIPMMNYLWKNRMNYKDCKELADRIGAGTYTLKNKKYTFVFIGKLNFEEMERTLNVNRITIWRDMKELSSNGFIKRFN